MDSITSFHLIVQEAPILLSIVTILFIIGVCTYRSLLYLSIICFVALLFCFRNPVRINKAMSNDPQVLVAPADGKIVGITYTPKADVDGYCYKISIVVSFLDTHVNRMPSAGTFTHVHHVPGSHVSLFNPENENTNEYTDVVVNAGAHCQYKMRQIAGKYVRRVVCWPQAGDTLTTGQMYGMILFGARFELFLPKNVRLIVGVGQHIRAGSTTIGYWAER